MTVVTRPLRPRDAATLIILREGREVLMGVRSARHVFMPHHYVFPGGAVDPGDARVPCPVGLRAEVNERLCRSVSLARARGLAMAAVRETFEETGLILGDRRGAPCRSRSPHWQPFYASGLVPALDKLRYLARAITPVGPPRRFDARFFLVDAAHLQGDLGGNGELEDLRWVPLAEASRLPLVSVTELVLELLQRQLHGPYPSQRRSELLAGLDDRELVEFV